MNRVIVSGKTFECTATPYPWPHGVGVEIDVVTSGKRVGSVHVLCASNQPAFDVLAALSAAELCDVALARFVGGDLPLTLEFVLWWQEKIRSMGYDYVSPLCSSFSRAETPGKPNPDAGLPHIECSITFLRPSDGGRSAPFPTGALSANGYRPHLVIGDPTQRQATVVEGHGTEEYIGVAFYDGPASLEAGVEITALLTLMFYPHPMYDKLQPGVTFTVREGAQVVGFGNVRRWL